MKIKKILISSLLVLSAFLGIIFATLLSNVKVPLVMNKAESVKALKAQGKYYELPVYVYHCSYDYQEDISFIDPITSNNPNDFYIDSDSFDLSSINNNLDCYVEQDTYYTHGNDGLPNSFYIISSVNLRGTLSTSEAVPLDGNTISSILSLPNILGLPYSGLNSYLDPFEFADVDVDTKIPVFDGYQGKITSNVDSPITIEEIKSLLKVVDEVDGDITNRIVIENDDYSENSRTLGTYPVVFSATDNSYNKATITINVQVVDVTTPTILGPDTIETSISSPISNNEILAMYTASDNYEGNLTSSITFTKNNYESADKTRIGTHEVILSVKDSSKNVTYKTINVIVKDDIKPLISGPVEYIKDYNSPLTLADIMSRLLVSDNIDGDLSSKLKIVEDNYSGNESIVGTYNIIFNVTDNSGNTSNNFKIIIYVEDNEDPVFYINSMIISTHTFEELSIDNIENYLIQTSTINRYKEYNLEIIENDYQKNKRVPGTYKMVIKVKYANGEEENINLAIFVNDNDNDLINEQIKDSSLDFSFFKAMWKAVCHFFQSNMELVHQFNC